MSANPYLKCEPYAFWRKAITELRPEEIDPVLKPAFRIGKNDKVATAGSCFAQHIARTLVAEGFNYLITEQGPAEKQFGVYPARFANIYTARQLLQLLLRAYGEFEPADDAWTWKGAWVDPFRPTIEEGGFSSLEALRADRDAHLAAVRLMFEVSDVFVFTLGLTEAWQAKADGAVVPVAPGVHGKSPGAEYEFINFSTTEIRRDLDEWIRLVRLINPGLRIILTVSPVPLVATYEQRHVLVSTVYSKAVLRAVAGEVAAVNEGVAYFPSFEIITGQHNHGRFFEGDLRGVTPDGVASVMGLFRKHYLTDTSDTCHFAPSAPAESIDSLERLSRVLCEEELLDGGAQ